jgi:hypothetical protein
MSLDTLAVLNNRWAVAGVVQTARGTATAPVAANDGMLPFLGDEIPNFDSLSTFYDGQKGRSGSSDGQRVSTTPNGYSQAIPHRVVMRGRPGTAYTASIRPPREVDLALRLSGFVATYSATPTPRWTYTRYTGSALDNTIGTVDVWAKGRRHRFTDVCGDFTYEAPDAGEIIANPNFMGLPLAPISETIPAALTGALAGYDAPTLLTPVAAGAVFAVGDFITPRVRSVSYASNSDRGDGRLRQNAAGAHLGWVYGMFNPQFTILVEETAIVGSPFHTSGGFDADALFRNATTFGCSVQYGTASGNRFTHAFTSAQLVAPPAYQTDNNLAMAQLTIGCREGTESVLFD